MLKKLFLSIVLIFGYTFLNAHGGANHSHKSEKISESDIQEIAREQIAILVEAKKIDKSWVDSYLIDTELKTFGKVEEWVVSFANEKMSSVEKKILYIFVTQKGRVTGANYTGA